MRKVLFTLAVLGILLTMSNCDYEGMNEDIDPETGKPYYPFEVSDVTHTMTQEPSFMRYYTFKWTNPTDENFSHVIIHNYYIIPKDQNTFVFRLGDFDFMTDLPFVCVSYDGDKSKGVIYPSPQPRPTHPY